LLLIVTLFLLMLGNNDTMNRFFRNCLIITISLTALVWLTVTYAGVGPGNSDSEYNELEKTIGRLVPDPQYRDDRFILATLQESIAAKRGGNGGVGACLVREDTGEIIARGHNRQYSPHFRSDMHAEMDLMNRYEEKTKVLKKAGHNPREQFEGLVLYSSVEPCPMCLTRIINTGIKKTYYAAPDPTGGMVHRISDLPSFWKNMTEGRIYAEANCSPAMKELAARLFVHGRRSNQ
jgi:tRNA(adenine34) deaminase